jgi:N-acetylglucosaminyldiphosphoundecaprenol N-acetyl-beta-D-mannosaminyltransferase
MTDGHGAADPRPEREQAHLGHRRLRFLDTWVDELTIPTFLTEIGLAVQRGDRLLVANHNVNSLALLQRSEEFREFYRRPDLIFVDGAAVVAIARALGLRIRAAHRIAVLDWLWPLCARAEAADWRVVHLGGDPTVMERASAKVAERHPRLSFHVLSGYFDMHDQAVNAAVREQIKALRPTILLVGMGMPRQEIWLNDNFDELQPCVTITVGGVLSYLGNDRPTPPRWLGRWGLEWLFRLVTEPRRLWRRYLLEPLVLLSPLRRALVQRLRSRRR